MVLLTVDSAIDALKRDRREKYVDNVIPSNILTIGTTRVGKL